VHPDGWLRRGGTDNVDTTAKHTGFGELLRAGRRAAGMNQQQLADRAGVSVSAIRDLEQGRTRRPRAQVLDALVAALDLTGDTAAAFRAAAERSGQTRLTRAVDSDQPVRVLVLGPLQVRRGLEQVLVGGGRRRALLGRLALSANAAVSLPDLVDLLWATEPSAAPAQVVQTYVSRLRSALQPAGPGRSNIISRAAGGYQLNLDGGQLDLADFRGHVHQARTEPPAHALELFESALKLWRGDPLEDLPELRHHPLVVALADERIAAMLCYADLAIADGQAERCLPALRELAAANPLHEPLHARLIGALAAKDLQAAALAAYTDIRRRLVDDLGIEPGHDLQDAHRRVLRQEPPVYTNSSSGAGTPKAGGVPAELPLDVFGFVGREPELAKLDRIAEAGAAQPTAVLIAVISGTAGVGKSALAVHWAHQVADRFPDGQLYLNLRGFDPTGDPMAPHEAIRRFLDALDVPARRVPVDPSALIDLYRSSLADKRVLIVLDNARDPEQVRPLLPGGSGCLVVVTSRNRLTGLIAVEGAHSITLNRLTVDEAQMLLARRLGPEQVAAEPDVVDRLITASAGLPLPLVIIAANAAVRPDFALAVLANDLDDADRRLDTLTGGDIATDLRAVFSWSYRALSHGAARLFRLLGLHPGAEVTTTAAASLAGITPGETRTLLAQLTAAHLVTEHSPRRYGLHDLLRVYAMEQALAHDSDVERCSAVRRVLDHYLHTAHVAALRLHPSRAPLVLEPPHTGVTVDTPADHPQATAWFTSEHQILVAAIDRSSTLGLDSFTWQLAWTLTDFLDRRGHWSDLAATHQAALQAAKRLDDPSGQAHAHRGLAAARLWEDRYADAHAHLLQAKDLFVAVADHAAAVGALFDLGYLFERQHRYAEALGTAQSALELLETTGLHSRRGSALSNTAWYHTLLGRHEEAITYCEQAIPLLRDSNPASHAGTLDTMGHAHHHLGQHQQAIACYQQALDIYRSLHAGEDTALVLAHLGDLYDARGEAQAACDAWQRALRVLDPLNHPDAPSIRAKLDGLVAKQSAHQHRRDHRYADAAVLGRRFKHVMPP
jgi:DNA-binding SARP family transcriptional activator/tetratricopeptide (TPR) repeat protein/DNA-binding XRE family transcriptional regulator